MPRLESSGEVLLQPGPGRPERAVSLPAARRKLLVFRGAGQWEVGNLGWGGPDELRLQAGGKAMAVYTVLELRREVCGAPELGA